MPQSNEYVPGVCNIGPAEIKKRRQTGIISVVISIALLVFLLAIHANPLWRLLVFFSVTSAASGFLQAYFHFCAGFGFKGVYNVVKPAGITESIQQKEFRKKDRQKALQITGLAVLIGLTFAGVIYYLPL